MPEVNDQYTDRSILSMDEELITQDNQATSFIFTEIEEMLYKTPFSNFNDQIVDNAKKAIAPGNITVDLDEDLGTVPMLIGVSD